MPGTEENMVGDYTFAELSSMKKADLEAARDAGFKKSADSYPLPPQTSVQPSDNVWSSTGKVEDFVTPSGQKCKLRPVSPEALIANGILDRVTRLEGLAAKLVSTAEGEPPSKAKTPSTDDFKVLVETVNLIVPLAVAEPQVYPDVKPGEEVVEGRIYVSMIGLEDRVAIMERSLSGLKALDSFRKP